MEIFQNSWGYFQTDYVVILQFNIPEKFNAVISAKMGILIINYKNYLKYKIFSIYK